jgi:hypothetical protein
MMHGHEKSDPAIVAKKPANNAGQPAAERVERRAGTEGSAGQQSTRRAQNRESVSQALERVRQASTLAVKHPRVGAGCGKSARPDLCGGRPETGVPTAHASRPSHAFRRRSLHRTDSGRSGLAAGTGLHAP